MFKKTEPHRSFSILKCPFGFNLAVRNVTRNLFYVAVSECTNRLCDPPVYSVCKNVKSGENVKI